ncbi:MAG: DJ-1/PfpI family protein [Bacteroides sp.]|nr:DJ-1/PfpI family protein [Bacteroides sp.]
MVYLFMADGFEEVEGLTVVDLLRRAGVELQTVSIMKRRNVISSHQVELMADILFEEMQEEAEMLILPGGIPGTPNLKAHEGLGALIRQCAEKNTYLAAICAAPTVYGSMGLLEGKRATCYPGMEAELLGAKVSYDSVVIDGNFITSRGLGTAIDFGLALTEVLKGKEAAESIAQKIVYER